MRRTAMGTLKRLGRWLEPPRIERVVYRCLDCESEFGPSESACTDCGGDVGEVRKPVEYTHWGPYH